MEEAIKNFPKQFEWEPVIENKDKLKSYQGYVLAGMGGSHLQGDVFQTVVPGFNLSVHQDYGLPSWPLEVLKNYLVIASSYSGNTEETVSVFEEAVEKGVPIAVLATGGKLLELAKKHSAPYIQVPDMGIQPRAALGFTFLALAKMVGREDIVSEARKLASVLNVETARTKGEELAKVLRGKIPVVCASQKNYSLAYNWKIKFNETGKIPAFYNLFSELNHNEMTGFDVIESTRPLSEKFHFIFLQDSNDHPQIQKRMEITKKLYEERELKVEMISLEGRSALERMFSSLLIADWTAYHIALHYGTEPEQVPMVEEFKKLIS
ncbi:MAG: bifunctional phosphoglucose/phosphomannose isomerase [Candidatus Wildermuthbacteria bacterium]|nr:bifunctional phosphoglucose/phosphomannose isomerase [Candidatus Wildermuthbacteria bacterium]